MAQKRQHQRIKNVSGNVSKTGNRVNRNVYQKYTFGSPHRMSPRNLGEVQH